MKRSPFRQYASALISCLLMSLSLQAFAGPALKVTDAFVQLPSGKVFYRDSGGKGIPVIFLHASSGNSMLWEHQIPAFTKAGYRFIAIDHRYRGGGNAGSPHSNKSSTLINELVAYLGLQKFHLLGTAAGGGTALQYALANREKLRSVIVANSIGNLQDKELMELGNRMHPAAFKQLPLEMQELGPSYRAANAEGVKRWLELSALGREPKGGEPATKTGQVTDSGSGMGGGPSGSSSPVNNPHAVTWANLERLTLPVLLMTGDADLYTPPSVLRMFSARLKQAESAVIAESGHSAYWENPDDFNRTVLAFISKY